MLYSYLLMSSGFYAFFWALSLMEALNELLSSRKFDVLVLRRAVIISLVLYVLVVLYLLSSTGSAPTPQLLRWFALAMPFGLMALLVWLVVQVHCAIGLLTSERRSSTRAIVGLTFMFFSSLPVLQTEINELILKATRTRGVQE